MAQIKGLSDFVLTGCAIVPIIGLAFDRPEFALLSHIVLLFGGILTAAAEDDSPHKQAGADNLQHSEQPNAVNAVPKALSRRNASHVPQPLNRLSSGADKLHEGRASPRKTK